MRNKHTTSLKLRSTSKPAFTLIELLVVIAIIGLLASIVLLALNGARQKSRDATRIADVREMASAFELFYNDASAYPTGPTGSPYVGAAPGAIMGSAQMSSGTYNFTPSYVGTIPSAPTPFDGSCNAANNNFEYNAPAAGTGYTLTFCLGASTGGYAAGPHILTPSGIQ